MYELYLNKAIIFFLKSSPDDTVFGEILEPNLNPSFN